MTGALSAGELEELRRIHPSLVKHAEIASLIAMARELLAIRASDPNLSAAQDEIKQRGEEENG